MELEHRIGDFIQGEESRLDLEPMNSYLRRLVHNLAKEFGLQSSSAGEGNDRYIVLEKTDDTRIPEQRKTKALPIWHYGDREFIVGDSDNGIDIFLGSDGTVGIYESNYRGVVVDRKVVRSKAFKIKRNKIVEYNDQDW